MPLMVIGARQVGKTYLIDKFCKSHFKKYCYINLMQDQDFVHAFHTLPDFASKVFYLESKYNVKLDDKEVVLFVDEVQESEEFIDKTVDYIIDCIDTVSSKIELILRAKNLDIPIISSMGTGNKLDPTKFEITDIYKTSVCPLAKVMRKELKNRGIDKLKVVYSKEEPIKIKQSEEEKCKAGSISFVPSVAGLIIAGEVIKDLIK